MDFGYNVQKGASAVNYFFANKVKTGAAAFSLFFLCFNGRKKAVRGSAKCEAMSFSIARGGIGRVEAASGTTKMGLSVTHFVFSRYSSFHVSKSVP